MDGNAQTEIRSLLHAFQDGYTQRDSGKLDAFMEMFTPDAEVIGTNGIQPGEGEWYTNRREARALVREDWESWGDLRLEAESAAIHVHGDVGWIAARASVTRRTGTGR